MNPAEANRLVSIKGECFGIAFQGTRTVAERDGVFHNFHLTDLIKGRDILRVSVYRGGPRDGYVPSIAEYDRREEVVVRNVLRRAFDNGDISFDVPTEASCYKEISLQPSDFANQPLKNDAEIRTYIIHKAYWLSYRHPVQWVPTNVMYPIQFDGPLDLEYLGANVADVLRNIQRLSNQGLLEKVLEANARPSERLLQLYESSDFAALGFSSGTSPKLVGDLDDRKFARMAIDEARKSVPENDSKPHPWVGAVVVKDGKVLSIAHRGEVAGNHAEFTALEKNLPDVAVAGATVYTTLEPCTTRNHPKIPCAQRLVERKVARVVMGMLDPNPDIRGLGDLLLSEANIETQLFPRDLRAQVEEMNREFIRAHKQKQLTKKDVEATAEKLVGKQLPPIADPKVEAILSFKGKVVTVFSRQKYGHGFLEGYWGNGAIIVDCTALWVVLQDPMTKDNQTFSLTKITVAFDNQNNRLRLEIER